MIKEKFYYIETKKPDGSTAILQWKAQHGAKQASWRIFGYWKARRILKGLRKKDKTSFVYRLCKRVEKKGKFK